MNSVAKELVVFTKLFFYNTQKISINYIPFNSKISVKEVFKYVCVSASLNIIKVTWVNQSELKSKHEKYIYSIPIL